jgi:2-polyprenyl-3-methyl-5-hydroxy-6-metoxy-1,4-benzoquinol methylase
MRIMQHTRLMLVGTVLVIALPCCRKQAAQVGRASTAKTSHPPAGRTDAAPAYPPIECPLAKAGVHPASLRPFEDVQKYIAFLERPERAAWQRPDAVVAALGLKGNETVVDIGAGSGYFAFRFARALPQGSVVAVDVEPEMVRHLHHKAMTDGVRNLRAVLGKAQVPDVPPEAGLIFVCDVLHHVADRTAWLARLAAEMSPDARLVIIEFKEGKLPVGPPETARIPKAELVRLVTAAGLQLVSERSDLLPYQYMLTFRKP